METAATVLLWVYAIGAVVGLLLVVGMFIAMWRMK